MDEQNRPEWIKTVKRIDRPTIERNYHPEEGGLDGFLLWQGDVTDQRNRDTYRVFVIEEANSGVVVGVPERAALRPLREAAIGSRVYIEPQGKRELGDGRSMWNFAVYVQPPRSPRGPAPSTPPAAPAGSENVPF
ncbi:MAG: hypothetical protein WBN22_12570 [Verrucomicrobiia bacterium]